MSSHGVKAARDASEARTVQLWLLCRGSGLSFALSVVNDMCREGITLESLTTDTWVNLQTCRLWADRTVLWIVCALDGAVG